VPLELKITSLDDLMRCIALSSLLEISGWPKPGNVHRTKDFVSTRFEHFLAGIAAIQPKFSEFCQQTYNKSSLKDQNYAFVNLGNFFKQAVKEMITWQKGGNVLLGHILILAPLSAATAICLKKDQQSFQNFKFNLNKVIEDSTVNDTINLYEAIRMCNPGGLGKIGKYDIYDENSVKYIIEDGINLKKIFVLSKDYDSISLEYSHGFKIILEEGLPYYLEKFKLTNDVNIATVDTFLKILAEHLDTLILRKSGLKSAKFVSKSSEDILKLGGISSEKGLKLLKKLDFELHENKGKLNPGTTADIVAGIIFCALIFGLIF
jgi:triphosphoribosyl-dephospho-CoA synthase